MIWLQLLYVYLKIGIFGFGGGYAMLSLIQADVVDRYKWISLQEFTDIVAISQMTPGPIGINSATYIGYTAIHNAGYSPFMAVLGSCLTTFAVCLPSFILVLVISYFFAKFKNNKYVVAAFTGLRPATVGLIAAAALMLMNKENFIDYKSFLIFGAAFILTLEVQGPSDTDDCIGRGCGVDIVLVIMRSPIAWPYALIYRRYRAMQTLEY